MTGPERKTGKEEADAILRRVDQQSEKLLGGGGSGYDDPASADPMEIWGKRLGRGLGLLFVVYLAWHLLSTYVFN